MDMNHIDRSSITYWLNGDGAWMDRWHCTGGDQLLFYLIVASGFSQIVLYLVYAVQNGMALRLIRESLYKEEKKWLLFVFLLCGLTHTFGRVIAYWLPLYYVESVLCIVCVAATCKLVFSKRRLLAFRELSAAMSAMERVEDARGVIAQERRKANQELLDMLDRVERSLSQKIGDGR